MPFRTLFPCVANLGSRTVIPYSSIKLLAFTSNQSVGAI